LDFKTNSQPSLREITLPIAKKTRTVKNEFAKNLQPEFLIKIH
jgi:hypothetical protein